VAGKGNLRISHPGKNVIHDFWGEGGTRSTEGKTKKPRIHFGRGIALEKWSHILGGKGEGSALPKNPPAENISSYSPSTGW